MSVSGCTRSSAPSEPGGWAKADDEQPRTLSWSLTSTAGLPWSTSLEIGYVGSKSDHQMNWELAEFNPVPPGAILSTIPGANADDTGSPDVYAMPVLV